MICAASVASLRWDSAAGKFGLTSTPITAGLGTSARSNSRRFAPSAEMYALTPVALPVGRLRLATKPAATGSTAAVKTIGIVELAALAASAAGGPVAAITVT